MAPGFIFYDLAFLTIFTLGVIIFLYKRRHNLQRQGLLYLYRTRVGIKFIEWTSNKFPRALYALQYVVIFSGYVLMIGMIYFLIKFSYFYLSSPIIAKALKIPVIVPLVPYLPQIFNIDFLPPFYFTYWILVIAVIAIPHEFAHGIFAGLNKIRIHSTGFGFLGPFLAAFVEPDEKEMEKSPKFSQLAILASGTFANIIFALLFGILFIIFFVSSFTPAGVIFNSYANAIVPISEITTIDGTIVGTASEMQDLVNKSSEFTEIKIVNEQNKSFFVNTIGFLTSLENNFDRVSAFIDSPAFRAKLSGAITEIDNIPVRNFKELSEIFEKYELGDKIKIKTIQENLEIKEYEIVLGQYNEKVFLGIGIASLPKRGILGFTYSIIGKIKDPFVYYQSIFGDFGIFIYNLLWWCVLVSISVALVNMLPLGIFDGGKFFYLTVWGLTKSKLIGERAFKLSTYLMLLLIAVLMIKWLLIFV